MRDVQQLTDLRRMRRPSRGVLVLVGAACVLGGSALALAYGPDLVEIAALSADPQRAAIKSALAAPALSELLEGYTERSYRPMWLDGGRLKPEALALLRQIQAGGDDDLAPDRYGVRDLLSRTAALSAASWKTRAQTDILISRAYAHFAADLHTPLPAARIVYTDQALQAPERPDPASVFQAAAVAPSLVAALRLSLRMNTLYLRYRQAITLARIAGDEQTLPGLRISLERMRALPLSLGRRFVLVDTAHAQLWMFENGQPVDSMKVIVGKPEEATPMMAGVIRYAVFNPYWNVPPDLVQRVYAPRIAQDHAALAALRMDPWSDYTQDARLLDPARVDWAAVAAGGPGVGLRQRPGLQNSMGAVKFMLPNELGIYLHDTPNKGLFDKPVRTFSAGCIRVQDYRRLARWLYGAEVGPNGAAAEQRIDLQHPTPVYITYLTTTPPEWRLAGAPDAYHRDTELLRQIPGAGFVKA